MPLILTTAVSYFKPKCLRHKRLQACMIELRKRYLSFSFFVDTSIRRIYCFTILQERDPNQRAG